MFIKKVATFLQLVIAAFILFFVMFPASAQAETLSPSLDSLYKVESSYLTRSALPRDLKLFDEIRISVDESQATATEASSLGEDEVIVCDAYVTFPALPEHLRCVGITDGYRWLSFLTWEQVSETTIHVYFFNFDLANFKTTQDLYLLLFD